MCGALRRLLSFWINAFLVLSIICLTLDAHSLQPRPQAQQTEKTPESKQYGSDEHPFTIKIAPAPDANEKAAKQEEYKKDKAEEDRRLTNATVWLAGVTTILAIFTGLLWLATYRLSRDAPRHCCPANCRHADLSQYRQRIV
jgi:hypothetical protein